MDKLALNVQELSVQPNVRLIAAPKAQQLPPAYVQLMAGSELGGATLVNSDYLLVDQDLDLYILTDGGNGERPGMIASKMAATIIQREVAAQRSLQEKYLVSEELSDLQPLRRLLEVAIVNACYEIYTQAQHNPELRHMTTACSVLWILKGRKGILAHVGDARLYMGRGGEVYQLSQDHTYVNELLKNGALSKEQLKAQALNSWQSRVLLRVLGLEPTVNVDTMIFDLDPGDVFLFCTKGIYNALQDKEELRSFLSLPEPTQIVKDLLAVGKERAVADNMTALVFKVAGEAPSSEEAAEEALLLGETPIAEQRIDILQKIPIFSNFNYDELIKVLGLMQLVTVLEREIISKEDELGNELLVILAGELELLRDNEVVQFLGKGAHLGEMALIDNAPQEYTVRAKGQVKLLVMRRLDFFTLIRSEPVIASKLLWIFVKVLSERLRLTGAALMFAQKELTRGGGHEDFEIIVPESV